MNQTGAILMAVWGLVLFLIDLSNISSLCRKLGGKYDLMKYKEFALEAGREKMTKYVYIGLIVTDLILVIPYICLTLIYSHGIIWLVFAALTVVYAYRLGYTYLKVRRAYDKLMNFEGGKPTWKDWGIAFFDSTFSLLTLCFWMSMI